MQKSPFSKSNRFRLQKKMTHVCSMDFSPKKGRNLVSKKEFFTLKGMLKEHVCLQFRAAKQLKQKKQDFFFSVVFRFHQKNEKSPLSQKKHVSLLKHVDCFSILSVKTLEKWMEVFLFHCEKIGLSPWFSPIQHIVFNVPHLKNGDISILQKKIHFQDHVEHIFFQKNGENAYFRKRMESMEIFPKEWREWR